MQPFAANLGLNETRRVPKLGLAHFHDRAFLFSGDSVKLFNLRFCQVQRVAAAGGVAPFKLERDDLFCRKRSGKSFLLAVRKPNLVWRISCHPIFVPKFFRVTRRSLSI